MSQDKYDMSAIFNPPETRTRAVVRTEIPAGRTRPTFEQKLFDGQLDLRNTEGLFDLKEPETRAVVHTELPYVRSKHDFDF